MSARSVLVAHRHAMVAEGLAAGLARSPHIVSLGVATDAEQTERLGARADAVVLDQQMPGADEIVAHLRRRGVRVVMVGEGGEELEDLRVSPRATIGSLVTALFPQFPTHPGTTAIKLTEREAEILRLISKGFVAKQVARSLGISQKTVEQHKTRIYAKLGVRNQTAAVAYVAGREASA